MPTLITFRRKGNIVHVVCTTKHARRVALLKVFKANPFKAANPANMHGTFLAADWDAYNMPEAAFDALGAALKEVVGEKRNRVRLYLERLQKEYDMVMLRDELLEIPVEEAADKKIVVDGVEVYAVDVITPVLCKLFKDKVVDWYEVREDLFTEEPVTILT